MWQKSRSKFLLCSAFPFSSVLIYNFLVFKTIKVSLFGLQPHNINPFPSRIRSQFICEEEEEEDDEKKSSFMILLNLKGKL